MKRFRCGRERHVDTKRSNALGSLFGCSGCVAKSSFAVSADATVAGADGAVNREDGDISSRVISTRQHSTAPLSLQTLGFGKLTLSKNDTKYPTEFEGLKTRTV